MTQGKTTTKKLLKSCLNEQETVLMVEIFDLMFLLSPRCV